MVIPCAVKLHNITAKDSSSLVISHHVSNELSVSIVHAQEAITNLDTARSYSFLTAGFSSRYPMWEAVDMLRKSMNLNLRKIVAFGSILNDPTTQAVVVIHLAAVWLCVQCIIQPYRFNEDNILKIACDLVIVAVCACELAVHWGSNNADDAYGKLYENYVMPLAPSGGGSALSNKDGVAHAGQNRLLRRRASTAQLHASCIRTQQHQFRRQGPPPLLRPSFQDTTRSFVPEWL